MRVARSCAEKQDQQWLLTFIVAPLHETSTQNLISYSGKTDKCMQLFYHGPSNQDCDAVLRRARLIGIKTLENFVAFQVTLQTLLFELKQLFEVAIASGILS